MTVQQLTLDYRARAEAAGLVFEAAEVRENQTVNAISVFAPILIALGLWVALGGAARPTWFTIVSLLCFFSMTVVGVGIGLHRYFTHEAFRTSRSFRAILAVWGCWAFQGPIDRWVADHRRHHRFADQPLDTHSPYWIEEEGARGRLHGLLHAHFLWLFADHVSSRHRYAPDIQKDPICGWCSRHYLLIAMASVLAPGLIGGLAGGFSEAGRGILYAGCLRVIVLHQLTWSVNSFGHMFGSKSAEARTEARDNLVLTFLLLGEGLHHYHHEHPRAAVNEPRALDWGGQLILALQGLNILWDCKT
jgi:stearoyl-CoA desaturase (delta-9 desaturase)